MLKRVITISLWIVGIMAGLCLVVAASIVIDRGMGVNRLDPLTNTVIPNGTNPAIRAYVARPQNNANGPFPVVIMIHEWWGLKSEIVGKADALAQDGYIVIAPDVFRGNTTDWIPTAIWQVSTTPTEQVDSDIDAVILWASNQPDVDPERVAIMGFCFGGGTAIRYSVNTPSISATAVFYGSTIADPALLKRLNGPVLGIFGGADTMIPQSEVEAFEAGLSAAGVPHEITVYPDMPHAFVKSIDEINQEGPQQQAWNQLRAFLSRALYGTASAPSFIFTAANPPVTPAVMDRFIHQFVCDFTTKTS